MLQRNYRYILTDPVIALYVLLAPVGGHVACGAWHRLLPILVLLPAGADTVGIPGDAGRELQLHLILLLSCHVSETQKYSCLDSV